MDGERASINVSVDADVYNISIQALRPKTKNLIAALLNPPKIFLSETGLSRDWQGLAQLVGIGGERVPHLQCGSDPTNKILTLWQKEHKEEATIKNLFTFLEQLDRFDIIDDIKLSVDEDILVFDQTKATPEVSVETQPDYFILTQDDLKRHEQGLGPQLYDAFILFAEDDIVFATELIENLEKHCQLKVCVKDRDLVPGVFEHESVIKLIAERCNRLVAVFSSSFFASSSNKFFLSFAQFLGIDQRRRKIIPCSDGYCKVPPEYSCYFTLDRGRTGFDNFWVRLTSAIKPTESNPLQNQNLHRSASQKLSPVSIKNDLQPLVPQFETNSLRPKKDGVKFSNSMINLKITENDGIQFDQNLNPSSNATSLTLDSKKRKSKLNRLKKIFPHKLFARNDKQKVALVN